MLEDFIESNSLEARVLPYVSEGKKVVCRLFSSEKGDFLAIFFSSDRISKKKLAKAVGTGELKAVPFDKVEDETGYLPEYLPPISVYGIRVIIDEKVSNAPKLRCVVGEEKTLEILPKAIMDSNEDSIVADITE